MLKEQESISKHSQAIPYFPQLYTAPARASLKVFPATLGHFFARVERAFMQGAQVSLCNLWAESLSRKGQNTKPAKTQKQNQSPQNQTKTDQGKHKDGDSLLKVSLNVHA